MLHLSEEKFQEALQAKREGNYRRASFIYTREILEMFCENDYTEFTNYARALAKSRYLEKKFIHAGMCYVAIITLNIIKYPQIINDRRNNTPSYQAFVNSWAPEIGYCSQQVPDLDYYNAIAGKKDPSEQKAYKGPDNSVYYGYYDPMKYFKDGCNTIDMVFDKINSGVDPKRFFEDSLINWVICDRNAVGFKMTRGIGMTYTEEQTRKRASGQYQPKNNTRQTQAAASSGCLLPILGLLTVLILTQILI